MITDEEIAELERYGRDLIEELTNDGDDGDDEEQQRIDHE